MNTNGIDSRNLIHTMLQLCHNLHKVDTDIIGLTEINVHWKKPNIFNNFERIVKKHWTKDKVATCISESNIDWNTEYKPVITVTVSLNNILFPLLTKD